MKININFWCVLGIVFSVVCAGKSGAEEMQTCPQGCFCIYDGKFPARKSMTNICGHGVAQRMSCDDANKVVSFAYAGGAYDGTLACTRDSQAEYYFDEFSELYITNTGMYGFIGQDLITMPFVGKNGYGSEVGVYQCPSSYPSSQAGAKTVFDCYKNKDGKKVYYANNNYENCDEALEVLSANLRFSLDKVNKTAQYLQNNLNNQGQKTIQTVKDKAIINTEIPDYFSESKIESKQTVISAKTSDSFRKIESDKVMINAEIPDSLVPKSKKIDMLKTQKTAIGKSMRSSGTRYVNNDLETKSDIDTSSNDIGTGYQNNDLEIKKRMISAGI